jgi:hypothetical protein
LWYNKSNKKKAQCAEDIIMKKYSLALAVALVITGTQAVAYEKLEDRVAGDPASFDGDPATNPEAIPAELFSELTASAAPLSSVVVLAGVAIDGVIADTPISEQAPSISEYTSTLGEAPSLNFPITMIGDVPIAVDECTITELDTIFDFNSTGSFEKVSDEVSFTVSCGADRSTPADIYASTNDVDPETGGGSDQMTGIFTKPSGDSVDFKVTVQDGQGKLGTSDAVMSAAGGSSDAYSVVATISDDEYVKMAEGGTITAAPDSNIFFWIK